MINVEEWAEIRRLHLGEGMAVKAIARRLGVARNTVRSALRSEAAPGYAREGPGSAVDAFEPAIKKLLAVTPDMPATVVAERIGWTRGMTVLRERVAELRPAYLPAEAFGRTEYRPGELCQWDLWFPDYKIPVGYGQTAVLPVLVGVACYSRWTLARMIASKESADVLGGHLGLIVELGRTPRLGVYDGEPAISVRRGPRLIYTQDYLRLKGTLGMGSIVLAKGHPERKGCVSHCTSWGVCGVCFGSGPVFWWSAGLLAGCDGGQMVVVGAFVVDGFAGEEVLVLPAFDGVGAHAEGGGGGSEVDEASVG